MALVDDSCIGGGMSHAKAYLRKQKKLFHLGHKYGTWCQSLSTILCHICHWGSFIGIWHQLLPHQFITITYSKGHCDRFSWSFPSISSSIYGWHHTRKKTLAEINNLPPPLPYLPNSRKQKSMDTSRTNSKNSSLLNKGVCHIVALAIYIFCFGEGEGGFLLFPMRSSTCSQ
jgi:hypothetical protein